MKPYPEKLTEIFRILFSIVIISLSTQVHLYALNPNLNDSLILATVKSGDIMSLDNLIKSPAEINLEYGKNKRTLLTFAIEFGQTEAARYLIRKGADIDQLNANKTPLMYAARYGNNEITSVLINEGVNINYINGDRNTAFHYAAKYNKLEILKILHENGAKINIPNWDNWTALDYSILNGNIPVQNYLKSIGCLLMTKLIPDYFDGPYVEILPTGNLDVKYLVNKERKEESILISKEISYEGPESKVSGLKKDKNKYFISTQPVPPPSHYLEQSRVFVLGDNHGQYERMVKMLIAGGVIDKKLRWSWGDGHLVIVGDVFDRGEGVMEGLWLIYRLEKEAEENNGKVHLLLGNHEVMIMKNDIRYIANKYYSLASNLDIDYYKLFSQNTVMGRWLRTKNVVEIIGNTMFIHAGISPELAKKNFSIEEINDLFREYLTKPSEMDPDLTNLLRGNYGPIWYRGYIKSSSGYEEIHMEELDSILKQYSVQQVVVGHTEVDQIMSLKNGKVIPVNIPLANKDIIEQALIIERNVLYRINSDKIKTKLNN